MIIVSGEPRTGTSMMMTTLKVFGYNVVGIKDPIPYLEKSVNPTGTWEIPKIVRNGLTENIANGKIPTILKEPIPKNAVVKLTTTALLRTERSLIDRVIYMFRYPNDSIESQMRLSKKLKSNKQETYEQLYFNYNSIMSSFKHDYMQDVFLQDNIKFVSYDQIIANPLATLHIVYSTLMFLSLTDVPLACVGIPPEKVKQILIEKQPISSSFKTVYNSLIKHRNIVSNEMMSTAFTNFENLKRWSYLR